MKNIIQITILLVTVWSCSKMQDWTDPKDNIAPGIISDVKVENLNGGAQITYSLPNDNDLLGVKAIYYFNEEEQREAFSSAFRDTIVLSGYPDTSEYLVKLITIDKSWNESQPVDVKINPLTPPVEIIRETLKVNPTFGGLFASWENVYMEDIAVSLFVTDSTGELVLYDTYYTNSEQGKITFRGLDNVAQQFSFKIRDRWENYSAPLDTTLKPLFEEEIVGRNSEQGDIWQLYGYNDRTCLYRGEVSRVDGGRNFNLVYDGKAFQNNNWWHPSDNRLANYVDTVDSEHMVLPIYFTIDMGRKASYSRLRYWMRSREPYFSGQTWSSFEVWGTNNPKALDEVGDGSKKDNLEYWTQWPEVNGTDEWKNDWVKMADCELVLPSGQTDPNSLTSEDREFIAAGFEFEIDPEQANNAYQYLRFVIREQRANSLTQMQVCELKFWGAYAE